ncbi:hypothetical protein NM208_g6433 [Fusarium decemcellulare]|uniref:Uncharacterized protein n=1 Tax=Fusarium decemcellulare TaxID=57161 RepID=A0ACC1SD06_9HYPO|nr:hypothetical protein NM208_g6433 [Fusarium decemcellulare]
MEPYVHPNGEMSILPPPRGYKVDFENPQRQYVEATYWSTGIFCTIGLLFLAQRFYGVISAETTLMVRGFAIGVLGVHSWELTIERFLVFSETLYPLPILYPICSLFAKMTLLLFYLDLSPQPWFRWSVYGTMFFLCGSQLGLFFASVFQCDPIAKGWNPTITGQCINMASVYQATAITGVISDVFVITIPIPMVINLKIPKRQKAGLMLMFMVGTITIVTSCIRLYFIVVQLQDLDVCWGAAPSGCWLIIEGQLMLICTTLPTLRTLFRHLAPKLIGERSTSSNTGISDNNNITIGGSGAAHKGLKRSKYSRFDDACYGMETTVNVELGDIDKRKSHDPGWEPSDGGDAESQKSIVKRGGILQTKVTSVTYHSDG